VESSEKVQKKNTKKDTGELGDSNPRPPAPEAGIIPLDQIPRVLRFHAIIQSQVSQYKVPTHHFPNYINPHLTNTP
jgi:hypothetical protein